MRNHIEQYWHGLAEAAKAMPIQMVTRTATMLLDCYHRRGTIFILGNGGSAATASHFACDLAKGTRSGTTPGFRVMPLTDNVPLMTAWANDTSYERIFAEQLSCLARPGDILIAISASGNSSNVLLAAEAARALGLTTIAFTGRTGGKLRRLADLAVRVPSDQIEIVEDAHVAISHSLCVALRDRLSTEIQAVDPGHEDPLPLKLVHDQAV